MVGWGEGIKGHEGQLLVIVVVAVGGGNFVVVVIVIISSKLYRTVRDIQLH